MPSPDHNASTHDRTCKRKAEFLPPARTKLMSSYKADTTNSRN